MILSFFPNGLERYVIGGMASLSGGSLLMVITFLSTAIVTAWALYGLGVAP